MTIDPVERLREWTSAVFLAALALVTLGVGVWEMVTRHGTDPGVDSALAFSVGVILAGKVAISRATKNDSP